MPRVQHVKVSPEEDGQKLYNFLHRRVQELVPRSALMRWIRTGQVRIDRSRSKPFTRVQRGQLIRIPPFSQDQYDKTSWGEKDNPLMLRRVYEDSRILVLAKPSNLPSQPGKKQKDSVSERIKKIYANSNWIPALVHRLDKDTSGLILLAKTYNYLHHLQYLWSVGKVQKIYLAWVNGVAKWSRWTQIQDRIYQNRDSEKGYTTAVSSVITLKQKKGKSLLAVRLKTGRKHQIRIQFKNRGMAIIGDRKYCVPSSGQGLLLHAWQLSWEDYSFTLLPSWLGDYSVDSEIVPPEVVGKGQQIIQ